MCRGGTLPEKLLRYQCKPRLYVLPDDASPFDGEADGLRVCEEVTPSENDRAPEDAVDYRIVPERPVTSRGDVDMGISDFLDLDEDLDRSWIYVTGAPLRGSGHRMHAARDRDPPGRTTVARDLSPCVLGAVVGAVLVRMTPVSGSGGCGRPRSGPAEVRDSAGFEAP